MVRKSYKILLEVSKVKFLRGGKAELCANRGTLTRHIYRRDTYLCKWGLDISGSEQDPVIVHVETLIEISFL